DDTFYVAIDGDLEALDATTGRPRWTGEALGASSWDLAGVVDDTLLARGLIDGEFAPMALDPTTGETIWTKDVDADWVAVLDGQLVVGGAGLRATDVTNQLSDSGMAGFDPATGDLVWDALVDQQYG